MKEIKLNSYKRILLKINKMKNTFCISLLLFFACSQALFSQTISPFKVDESKKNSIVEFRQKANVKLYQVLNTDINLIKNFYDSSPNSIQLNIPVNGNELIEVELTIVDIFASDFQVTVASTNSEKKIDKGIHYKGKIKGVKESLVSISVYENEISGFISSKNENLSLGKLRGENWRNEHVIYDDGFLFQDKDLECGTIDDRQSYDGKDLELINESDLEGKCVKLYFEVDYDIYSHFGNLNSTSNYITGLISQVIILYQNEGIETKISELKIWDVQSPYSGNSSGAMLSSFEANTGSFNGDLAQLLSFKASGGIASGFSGLCNSNPDESKSFSSITSTYSNVPTFSWSVQLVTHEFGHLFGSRHTHACVWNGNNTAIDGCSGFTEGNCSVPGYPSQGGTIMSYCHFNDRPGIEFNLGFGGQPGNIIRGNVIASACINADELTDCFAYPAVAMTPYDKSREAYRATHSMVYHKDNSNEMLLLYGPVMLPKRTGDGFQLSATYKDPDGRSEQAEVIVELRFIGVNGINIIKAISSSDFATISDGIQTMSFSESWSKLNRTDGYYIVRMYIKRSDTNLEAAAVGYKLCSGVIFN